MATEKSVALEMVSFRCPGCLGSFISKLPPMDKKLPKCPACKKRGWLISNPNLDRLVWEVPD